MGYFLYQLLYQDKYSLVMQFLRNEQEEISPFHLVIWLFWMGKIEQSQMERINAIYDLEGSQDSNRSSFSPFISRKEDFSNLLAKIKQKNAKCIIKVVTDDKYLQECLRITRDCPQVAEVYLYKPSSDISPPPQLSLSIQETTTTYIQEKERKEMEKWRERRQRYKAKYKKFKNQSADLNEIIVEVEKEVVKWTQNYRTFHNSLFLAGDSFAEEANRYRYRLFSCININVSDFKGSLNKFKSFVQNEVVNLRNYFHQSQNKDYSIGKLQEQIKMYLKSAQEYIKREVKQAIQVESSRTEEEQLRDKQAFLRDVLDSYQANNSFCHIINSNLRTVRDKISTNWKSLALPFFHLYHAINHFYQKQMRESLERANHPEKYQSSRADPLQITSFQVFRGGIIRENQLNQFREYKSGVFVEFFGFLSTSLSPKVVLDKFIKNKNSKDYLSSGKKEDKDERCIFKINCKFNPKIQEQIQEPKYSFLNHGFYRFKDGQNIHGEKEEEVLFNALNVFRFVGLKKMRGKDLLAQEDRRKYEDRHDSVYGERDEGYEREITVIELNYGDFFQVLFEKNHFNLSDAQKRAKQNYITCINKSRKIQWFDIADAHIFTNQTEEAYNYLRQKVSQDGNIQDFNICRIDRKNHFSRLAEVAVKMGKVKEALTMNKISIKCFEQLECLHHRELYQYHIQKVLQMHPYIKNLEALSDYRSALEFLQKQHQFLQSKHFTQPEVVLLKSENEIDQGVNYFSVGKLKKSMSQFQNSSKNISNVKEEIRITKQQVEFSCGEYLCFLLREKGVWTPTDLRDKKMKELEKEFIKKIGGEDQMSKIENKIIELSDIAASVLQKQKKVFRNEREFEQLIQRFQQSSKIHKKQGQQPKTDEEKLEQQIKDIIKKIEWMKQTEINSSSYTQLLTKFKLKCDNLQEYEGLKFDTNFDPENLKKIISQFKQDQRERRILFLRKKKEEMIKQKEKEWLEMFNEEVKQLESYIFELKAEGFTQNSLPILRKRNQIAALRQQTDQRQDALKEIQKIVKDSLENQCMNEQLFKAYFTEGKILYSSEKQKELKEALNCIDRAIFYVEKSALGIQSEEFVSQQSQKNRLQTQKAILRYKNSNLELRIFKAKALLKYSKLFNQLFMSETSSFNYETYQYVLDAQKILDEVKEILDQRSQLEDLSDLSIDLKEAEAFLLLTKGDSLDLAFNKLQKCSALREHKIGKNNSVTLLMWCEVIIRFHKDKAILDKVIEHGANEVINQAEQQFVNSTLSQIISRAINLLNTQDLNQYKQGGIQFQFIQDLFKQRNAMTGEYAANSREEKGFRNVHQSVVEVGSRQEFIT